MTQVFPLVGLLRPGKTGRLKWASRGLSDGAIMNKKAILALMAGALPGDIGGFDEERRRLDFLVTEIERHNELYYGRNEPEISDDHFDELFLELKELEARRPDLARPGGGKH